MNEKTFKVNLLEITDGNSSPFGNVQGKEAFRRLIDLIDANPRSRIIGVSLAGIISTDASFPRESVVAAARQFRGERGIFLEGIDLRDVSARDVIDNWKYAAIAKEQPLVIWGADDYELIGPKPSDSNLVLIERVLASDSVSAAQIATELDTSVQNASTRLKKLVEQGYIMRSEVVADSGGIEFLYHSIK